MFTLYLPIYIVFNKKMMIANINCYGQSPKCMPVLNVIYSKTHETEFENRSMPMDSDLINFLLF